MDATVGRETDALTLFAALSETPYRHDFYQTLRRLECLFDSKPRWGHSRRPVDDAVRFGQQPELSFAPAPLSAFETGRDGRPPRLSGAALRAARSQRPVAVAPHRIRARSAVPGRRPDAQPLPRSVPSPLPDAVLSGVGPGTAARQPRSPEGRSVRRPISPRSWAWRPAPFAIAMRCRTSRSSSTSAR